MSQFDGAGLWRADPSISGPDPEQAAIAVLGAGYVGLVTAACLASVGNNLRVIDVDSARIAGLRLGVVPFSEPGLEDLVREGLATGRLSFHDAIDAADGARMVFVAVGTLDDRGRVTDTNVRAALAGLLGRPQIAPEVVIRSTLAPGTMRDLQRMVADSTASTHLLSNPEFMREGNAIGDFLAPDRIVIGIPPGSSPELAANVRAVYAPMSAPIVVVDHAAAEMIKIGSNAFLAMKVTFANELARVSLAVGADIESVRAGIGLDSRIGGAFMTAGPGFGGSCLPSQIEMLTEMSADLGLDLELIPAVGHVNRELPRRLIRDLLATRETPKRVGVLGLAFKANTNDTRESPALRLIDALTEFGVHVIRAYDPAVLHLPSHPNVILVEDPYSAAVEADILIIATEWDEFRTLDWSRLGEIMAGRDVFDARSVIERRAAVGAGFVVQSAERRARSRAGVDGVAA